MWVLCIHVEYDLLVLFQEFYSQVTGAPIYSSSIYSYEFFIIRVVKFRIRQKSEASYFVLCIKYNSKCSISFM